MQHDLSKTVQSFLVRTWKMACCPYCMPWFRYSVSDRALRTIELRQRRISRSEYTSSWVYYVEAVLWPPITIAKAIFMAFGRRGRIARQHGRVGRFRQIMHQIALANFYNIRNDRYYGLRMYLDKSGINSAKEYFIDPPLGGIFDALNDESWPMVLRDKLLFHDHCLRNGIKPAPVLAVCSPERVEFRDGLSSECLERNSLQHAPASRLPAMDLFIKPKSNSGGVGSELWINRGAHWSRGEEALTAGQLLEHCCAQSHDDDVIVMPRLTNRSDLSEVAPYGLATLRVITCRERDEGSPWVLLSTLRLPVGDMAVDNFGQGGLAAPVQIDGTVAAATRKTIEPITYDTHPDTGGRISGRVILGYKQALDLCIAAHQTMPHIATIGWDVVFTDDGMLLLEGNSHWCSELAQIPYERPLGSTDFYDWLLRRLVRCNAA